LRQAELARVEAQTRVAEERKRRRITVALAASVLIAAGVVGGSWAYLARMRERRAADVDLAQREAEVLRDEALRAGDDLARWSVARNAAQAVARLAADARDATTRKRLEALVQEVNSAAETAENDQKFLAKLVDIRSAKADDPDGSETDMAYTDVFREAGIDVDALAPADASAKIRARPASVASVLVAALDDWALSRRKARPKAQEAWKRLVAAARAADPEPLRNRMRELWSAADPKTQLDPVRKLAQEVDPERWPAQSLLLLCGVLIDAGDPHRAEALLRRSQVFHPDDVWVNYNLGLVLEKLSCREEAIRFYTAARAVRPETAHELGHALEVSGRIDEALTVFRHLRNLRPGNARHFACLGKMLREKGLSREADEVLEEAAAVGREQILVSKDVVQAHLALGYALAAKGKHGEAASEYRAAIRLKPDYAFAYNSLGIVLMDQGKHEEAIAEFLTAMRFNPGIAGHHSNLGLALSGQGKLDEAIAEYREALRLDPDFALAHYNLGVVLGDQGKLDEAIAEYRTALRLKSDYVKAHGSLGNALKHQGKLAEAIAEYRIAIRLKPDSVESHANLGLALRSRGDLTEAIVELRKARELARTNPRIAQQVERELAATERQASLDARLPVVLAGKLKPADAAEMLGFATLDLGQNAEASGVVVDANGNYVIVGSLKGAFYPPVGDPPAGSNGVFLARFTPAGALDPTFGTNGVVSFASMTGNGDLDEFRALALDASGNIVVAGDAQLPIPGNIQANVVARFTPTGALDTTFGGGKGWIEVQGLERGDSVAIQPNGAIVEGGYADDGTGNYGFAVQRFLSDGSIDTSFNATGILIYVFPSPNNVQPARGLALGSSGNIVLAGWHDTTTSAPVWGVLNIQP
jgi:uncharacterized delta-60 repeat protein